MSRSWAVLRHGVRQLDACHRREKRSVESVHRVSDEDSEESRLDNGSKASESSSLQRSLLSRVDGLTKLTADYLLSSSEEESDPQSVWFCSRSSARKSLFMWMHFCGSSADVATFLSDFTQVSFSWSTYNKWTPQCKFNLCEVSEIHLYIIRWTM